MNKTRLENLSDGVFAIVMTLLIIDIKVPDSHGVHITNMELWQRLWDLWPVFRSYVISFIVLGMYWMSHHALFHLFAKNVNRVFANKNNLFLMFLALIPFSAHLLGQYPYNELAVIIYGINIILLGITFTLMYSYVIANKELVYENLPRRLYVQATIRVLLTPSFAFLGILVCFYNVSLSFFLFAFPIVFNIIPGTLDGLERVYLKIRGTKK